MGNPGDTKSCANSGAGTPEELRKEMDLRRFG